MYLYTYQTLNTFADIDGDTLNLALVQYLFSQGEHKLKIAPHGNSRYGQPYVRTMPVKCDVQVEERNRLVELWKPEVLGHYLVAGNK